ncbi:hypothetical protein GRI38_09060 [Altererythrobacter aurantiacus]|uniref:Phage gp6-like head-tail connector protein n=1 Tax=Parapontixanthobacter aurantiacus TaxID=1463599 RepID=A0A844ZGT5_9SPHN|nr:phage head-tail connector protein [Parapontixanthobacter aurantiacus]MXO86177.1 hypothetical protein [Parapontixanthobacter aurantiacus]
MNRAFVVPADFGGDPLDELKQWLVIANSAQDALLDTLLRSAASLCETFTGSLPLAAVCEERLPVSLDWQRLGTRPVTQITEIAALGSTGNRKILSPASWEARIEADGTGFVKLIDRPDALRVSARFSAGLAEDWSRLDPALRQGIVRLAAHSYRERDEGSAAGPPAAVAALWRPHRRVRLL